MYDGLLTNHLYPAFGDLGMADIDEVTVRRWRKERLEAGPKAERPFGPVTVAKAYRLLHAIFETAAEDRIVSRNPCRIAGAGKEESDERAIVPLPIVFKLAETVPVRYRTLVLLATFADMRWGEPAGLRRENIDLDACEIRITETLAHLDKGGLRPDTPKSRAGRRVVAFPAEIAPEIRWHLERFAEPGHRGFVFVGPKGGQLRRSNFHRTWDKARTSVGLPGLHFHDLRHTGGTLSAVTGATLKELMARLGHYAGDLVKLIMLGDCLVEAGQQSVEDFLAPGLALGGGVVALLFEGGAELDGGLEERARFADGLEVAIQADGAGAVAVAEHALVHFGAELAHLGALGAGGQVLRGVVEGLDLLRHREVFLGHGAVGDAGIDHGHPHRSMAEKGGYRLEAHAPVDGLGGQRVTQAMGADVADPGGAGSFGDGPVDAALTDALAVLGEQVRGAQAGGPLGEPGIEEVFELGVQRDIAVGTELAERHVQPVGGADLHDRIDGEVQEFAFAQAFSQGPQPVA